MTARGPSTQRGVVLLVVLFTTALLTLVVMEFTFATQVDHRRAAHWLQAEQARLLARSGIELGREILAQSPLVYSLLHGEAKVADSLAELWAGLCAPPGPNACPNEFADLCVIDTGAGRLALRITDESGLYNVNRLVRASHPAAERERSVFERIAAAAGVEPEVLGALADWVDADDRPFPFGRGAESSVYASRNPPYSPRNAPFETFGELALVAGLKPPDLVRLRRFVTVLDPSDTVTINVNTAPVELLAALDPAIGPLAAELVAQRCQRPFASVEDLRRRIPGWPHWLGERWIHVRSAWFRIRATAMVGEVRQSAEALVHREGDGIRVVYYVTRRGVVIPQAEEAQAFGLDEVAARASSESEMP
ncbi:MAG: general secretion pathway protein GspK [Candidatus Dadabacteria bacterium]|nr:MAG: general secretion pathway protein GspK [Candidatus Dadabacteria bacterium]